MQPTETEMSYYRTIHNFAKKNGWFPSRQELADERGVNKNAVQKVIKKLIKKDLVKEHMGRVYETNHAKLNFLSLSQK